MQDESAARPPSTPAPRAPAEQPMPTPEPPGPSEAAPDAPGGLPAGVEFVDLAVALGVLAGVVLAALLIHFVLFRILCRLADRTRGMPTREALAGVRRPVLLLFIVAGVHLASPTLDSVIGVPAIVLRHALTITMIVATAWLAVRVLDAATRALLHRFDTSTADNLQARRIHTQMVVLRRVIKIVVGIIAAGAILMTFPAARQFGASVLASAGIAGLAVGLAARSVVENLLAGIQIAITQPIRLDDVVIVDGEWGRIEEITATFVVVNIWDQRRLIVPLSRFINEPFENWTRRTAQLIGTVFVYADYTVSVPRIREWLNDYLPANPKWDGRVSSVQVTETTERTIQIRVLVSAANSGDTFALRCDTREALIGFINREFPGALPLVRSAAVGPDGAVLDTADPDDADAG